MPIDIVTLETPGLGDRSYLVHDQDVALVVDPPRDIDRVLALADDVGVTIRMVLETHVHNDYVSGGLALCRATGATLVASADAELSFDWDGVADGDERTVGSMRIRAVGTPGHTHDHLAYVIGDDRDQAVFTGGSMLYGTVGRTDLLGEDVAEELTRAQWRSVRRLVDELDADVTVHPTHGFGSFCASAGGAARRSGTIADEADDNVAVRIDDVDHFVAELLAGLSEYPAYYAHMALLNRAGAAAPDLGPPTPVDPDTLRARLEEGAWVIDLRDRRAFAGGHLVGSVSFEIDGPFVTYVGWLIPWGSAITLVADDPADVARAQRELVRIGIERPSGAATGTVTTLAGAHPVRSHCVVDFGDLAEELRDDPRAMTVVDVRRADEFSTTHVVGARNIPIHELLDHLHHVPDGPLWVHCASGARASIAAGLLGRAGHDVVLIDDHVDAAASTGVPMT